MAMQSQLSSNLVWLSFATLLTGSCGDGDRVDSIKQRTESPDAAGIDAASTDATNDAGLIRDAGFDAAGTSDDGGGGGTPLVDGGGMPIPSTPPLLAIETIEGLFIAQFEPTVSVHQITSQGLPDPIWSPDGRSIAWAAHYNVVITDITDLEAPRQQELEMYQIGEVWKPAWSSDSRQLAYVAEETLHVVDTAQWPPTNAASILIEDRQGASAVNWAPGRDALVLSNTTSNGEPVRALLIAGVSGEPPQIRDLGLLAQHAFSIDGDWFLYRPADEPYSLQAISLAQDGLADTVELMLDEPGAMITSFAPVKGGVIIGAVDDDHGGMVRFKSLDDFGAPDVDLNPESAFPGRLTLAFSEGGIPIDSQVLVQRWANGAVASFSYQDDNVQLGPFFQAFDGRTPPFEAYMAQELTINSWDQGPLLVVSPNGRHAIGLVEETYSNHALWQHSSQDLPHDASYTDLPLYSADSQHLLVRDGAAVDYKVLDLDSGEFKSLHSATLDGGQFYPDSAAWAPYGAYLALADAFTGTVEFFNMGDMTGSPVSIPIPIPDFSPSGSRLIWLKWQGIRREGSWWGL